MKNENIKKNLVDNAFNIIDKQGVAKLSMRKLTKASNCSLGGFYNFFKNVDDLMYHINARSLDILFQMTKVKMYHVLENKNTSYKDLLFAIGQEYLAFSEKHVNLWKSLFESTTKRNIPLWYKEQVRANLKEVEDILSQKFNLPSEQTHRTVTLFWAAIHGVCSIFINKKIYVVDDIIDDQFINFYLSHCIDGLI